MQEPRRYYGSKGCGSLGAAVIANARNSCAGSPARLSRSSRAVTTRQRRGAIAVLDVASAVGVADAAATGLAPARAAFRRIAMMLSKPRGRFQ